MPQPASAQLQVVAASARYRSKHPRPVGVQLAIGVPKHVAAIDSDRGVAIVIVLPVEGVAAGPCWIMLTAVDLHERVRRDLAVEATGSQNDRLRHPRNARVTEPQPHKGLAVRVILSANERAPALNPHGSTREHCIHSSGRPL